MFLELPKYTGGPEPQSLDAGRKEGQAAGLRTGILDLCEVLGVPLTPADHAELEAMDAEALTGLRDRIKRERRFR